MLVFSVKRRRLQLCSAWNGVNQTVSSWHLLYILLAWFCLLGEVPLTLAPRLCLTVQYPCSALRHSADTSSTGETWARVTVAKLEDLIIPPPPSPTLPSNSSARQSTLSLKKKKFVCCWQYKLQDDICLTKDVEGHPRRREAQQVSDEVTCVKFRLLCPYVAFTLNASFIFGSQVCKRKNWTAKLGMRTNKQIYWQELFIYECSLSSHIYFSPPDEEVLSG